jgi:hypothetical protein
MTRQNWLWPLIRLCWIVVGLAQGPWLAAELDAQNIHDPSWTFAAEMIAIVAAGVVFVVGLQAGRRSPAAEWPRPSWFESPFGRDRWVPLFDASAYYVLATGISCAIFELRGVPKTWAWEIPISTGLGLLIGARACLFVFRRHFRPRAPAQT